MECDLCLDYRETEECGAYRDIWGACRVREKSGGLLQLVRRATRTRKVKSLTEETKVREI